MNNDSSTPKAPTPNLQTLLSDSERLLDLLRDHIEGPLRRLDADLRQVDNANNDDAEERLREGPLIERIAANQRVIRDHIFMAGSQVDHIIEHLFGNSLSKSEQGEQG